MAKSATNFSFIAIYIFVGCLFILSFESLVFLTALLPVKIHEIVHMILAIFMASIITMVFTTTRLPLVAKSVGWVDAIFFFVFYYAIKPDAPFLLTVFSVIRENITFVNMLIGVVTPVVVGYVWSYIDNRVGKR